MPNINKALDVYVRLAAHACEMESEDFRPILEGYYELRRVAEDDLRITQQAIDPKAMDAALKAYAERAGGLRAAVAESVPPAVEESPAETQVAQAAFEPVPPPVPTRGTAAAKFKRDVRDRIEALRKQGVSLQSIIDATGGAVSMSEILDVLQAARIEYQVYRDLDGGLRKLESAE